MDIPELINTQQILPSQDIESLGKTRLDQAEDQKKKQLAKDFESLLINTLLNEMKNTIGSWGFEKDGSLKQVQDIFWMYLARDISNNGGFGLWKDVYNSLPGTNSIESAENSIDGLL